jgi:colicin import membrane protein
MRRPSIQRLTVLSLVFHLSFFLAVVFAVKQSARFIMPSPYVVSLVESEGKPAGKSDTVAMEQPTRTETPAVAKETTKETKRAPEKAKNVSKAQEKQVSEQIAALEAKRKMKRLAELRNITSSKGSGEGKPASRGAEGKGGSTAADYSAKVQGAIWQNWILPETSDKSLEATVSIRILKDGRLQVTRIEKSSGNGLFDRSALRAIVKTDRVDPPPNEMEIGVRFHP